MATKVMQFIITGRDELSPKLRQVGASTDKTTKSMRGAFVGVSKFAAGAVGIYGVAAAAKASFEAMVNLDRETRLISNAIKVTGNNAHVSVKHLTDMAGSISTMSGSGKVAVLQTEKMLLAFTNIRNETGRGNKIFDRSTMAVMNYAAATGKDASGAARIFGKALQDPVGSLGSLSRAGIKFTAQQTAQIKKMAESGNMMGAQKLILKQLENRYGGAARAAGQSFGGQMKRLKNTMIGFGVVILKSILPFLQRLLAVFLAMPKSMQQIIVFSGLAIIAFKAMGLSIKTVGLAMKAAFITNPIGLIIIAVVALGVVIYKFRRQILRGLTTAWRTIRDVAVQVWNNIGHAFGNTVHAMSNVFRWLRNLISAAWNRIKGVALGVFRAIRNAWGVFTRAIAGAFNWVRDRIIDAWHAVQRAGRKVWDAIKGAVKGLVNGLRNLFAWFVDKILAFFGTIVKGAAKAFGWLPVIGTKLKRAAANFDTFRKNVNNALRGIDDKKVNVKVGFNSQGGFAPTPSGKRPLAGFFATGGPIYGHGTDTSDSNLAYLSRNEYVIQAKSHKKYGTPFFNAVNAGKFANGGPVGFATGGSKGVYPTTQMPNPHDIRVNMGRTVVRMALQYAKSLMGSGVGPQIVQFAKRFIGKVPYVWGGDSTSGWDCSGFVSNMYRRFGLMKGRMTTYGFKSWGKRSRPMPGGFALFGNPPHHMGLLAGGNRMIEAKGRQWGTVMGNISGNSGTYIPPKGFLGSFARGARGGGMLPANYDTIFRFLIGHGYSPNAAAGIAGNIQRESHGNPESIGTGGGGLIGWTPLPRGMVTGNYGRDLFYQLRAILRYNQIWKQYIPMLNRSRSPSQAALIYSRFFERPGIPANAQRMKSAQAVASAMGFAKGGAVSYDRGGILRPGYTLAYNGTGADEYVGKGGGGMTVNIYPRAVLGTKREIARYVTDALEGYSRKGGRLAG